MTADISRHSLRPLQKFTGVVRQQGRLPLDAEETEAGDIGALMLREAIAETICEKGAVGDGFRISTAALWEEGLIFKINAGSFYLAGLRLTTWHSATLDSSFRTQPDWLTIDLDNADPSVPEPGETRTDLVWLEAWEQTVTATEDAELYEVALGGADSAARRRAMNRVRVLEDVPDNCPDAFAELIEREFPGGTLDAAGCEVLSNTDLTIGFTQLEPLEDLCRPSAQAGFLGARNETFRIQITEPGRCLWSRDNAAPLFRVQVAEVDGQRRRIVFLTEPRDAFGWPLAGMTVELLRWGAKLENGEKVAEPSGLLLRVETGYDPATSSIDVGADIPQAWDDWFDSSDGQAALNPLDDADAGLDRYFFLRVWTGGGADGAVDHPFLPGTALDLGETGLTATFSDTGMPRDYWIVSARNAAPIRVTPHALLTGAPPVGPRRLVAPLALLPWTGPVPQTPLDCRHRFRPLCNVGGCCRVTVGDGVVSHGDVTSVADALQLLPPEGGEICIHEGTYAEAVLIEDRQNITITGCGRGTIWQSGPDTSDPFFTILDSTGIHMRRLTLEAPRHEGVLAKRCANLVLEDIRATSADRSAFSAFETDRATVRRCRVDLVPLSAPLSEDTSIGRTAAIVLGGSRILVDHCHIEAAIRRRSRMSTPAGGIHILARTKSAYITDNTIVGGNGHGITLGSVQYLGTGDNDGATIFGPATEDFVGRTNGIEINPQTGALDFFALNIFTDPAGCIRLPGDPGGRLPIPGGPVFVPESGGVVFDIRILRNDIARMGFNGISSHAFDGLGPDGRSDLIAVETIEIAENRIIGCMVNEVGASTPLGRQFIGWGGIALSLCSDGTIRDNAILNNGANGADAVCGVFMAIAEDVRVERNRIEGNGLSPTPNTALAPGRRGGIVIGAAIGGVSTYATTSGPGREADRPALFVTGNTVDAPGGRALKSIALGPVIVTNNRLTGAGRSAFEAAPFAALVGFVLAAGQVGEDVFDASAEIDLIDYAALEVLSDVLGGDAVSLFNLCVAEDLSAFGAAVNANSVNGTANADFRPERLRGGEMLINDNQIALRPHGTRAQHVAISSVLLLSADDVSFQDNQTEIEAGLTFALTDLFAIGGTLRVTGNRIQKPMFGGVISAMTNAIMNQTAFNQTTHCIVALGFPSGLVNTGNREVFDLIGDGVCARLDAISTNANTREGVRRQPVQLTIG